MDENALALFAMYCLAVLGMAIYLIGVFLRFIRKLIVCQHLFRGPDLQSRDSEGFVTWPCSKCGKVFREPCGLDMGKHGQITGPWGTVKES